MPKFLSDLELPRDPDAPLESTTKQYVDAHIHALGDLSDVTATGEGAGGGFDADTVDGQHASAFAESNHGHGRSDAIDMNLLLGGM